MPGGYSKFGGWADLPAISKKDVRSLPRRRERLNWAQRKTPCPAGSRAIIFQYEKGEHLGRGNGAPVCYRSDIVPF